jgi:hypothetical protein
MPTVRYTVMDGEIIAEKRAGVRRFYVPDPLGSTRALLDNTQTQTDTFDYWPYGEERSRTGTTPTPFRFVGTAGYYRDNAGRVCDGTWSLAVPLARWLSRPGGAAPGLRGHAPAYQAGSILAGRASCCAGSQIVSAQAPGDQGGDEYTGCQGRHGMNWCHCVYGELLAGMEQDYLACIRRGTDPLLCGRRWEADKEGAYGMLCTCLRFHAPRERLPSDCPPRPPRGGRRPTLPFPEYPPLDPAPLPPRVEA